MRVVQTHHLADDARALVPAAVGPVATVVHGVQHPAMHGLEPVADVGQGASDDHAHRIVEVGALDLDVQVDLVGAGRGGFHRTVARLVWHLG